MKLITYSYEGATHVGALVNEGEVARLNAPDMLTLLGGGEAALKQARETVAAGGARVPLSAVKVHAPIPRPGKIICIGLNYSDHAAETGQPIPTYPIVFAKYANTVIADGEAIVLPKVTQQVDYEAELGFVMGKTARHVKAADALSYVAGYLPINDVSARDYQTRVSQWTMGKTFDTFAPMGPALTTADEIPNPNDLKISLTLNGETLQDSSTNKLIFNVQQLIEALTEVMTLEPGDVVSTGTPPGVGMARKPQVWLKAGDVVNVTIEGLGTLSNPVVAE
ncbi:MAG: fumarylacetoacetate hydrolase family protein [Anaerolineae bacterium]|nr:fumarylacetoacetate hydrolase family protein [Anaerolineae bacterium]